jgi:ubiquitin C-terminal hydrolase
MELPSSLRNDEVFRTSEKMKRIGLLNMGSTCFMNSILYVLINNPVLLLSNQFRRCSAASCKLPKINRGKESSAPDIHVSAESS